MKHPLAYLLAAGVLAGLGASMAAADTVPQVITYQGQIQKTSGVALNKGVYIIVARIWDNATGGSVLWARLYPVNVDGSGNFNVNLGDGGGTILPTPPYNTLGGALDGGARYLGITVVQTPTEAINLPPEITPRMQLVSSPYSLHAGMADYALTWNGLTASQLASVSASAARARSIWRASCSAISTAVWPAWPMRHQSLSITGPAGRPGPKATASLR